MGAAAVGGVEEATEGAAAGATVAAAAGAVVLSDKVGGNVGKTSA